MSMNTQVNDPFTQLNPVFYPFWLAPQSHKLAKGGRSSTKSSVISLKLVQDKMRYPDGNVVALRKVANTLRKSVYSQIKWALIQSGVADQFNFTTNPLEIIHKEWGTGFYFSGADDPEKLKSFKIPVGYVKDLWFEEMDAFDGPSEIDTIEDSFIREDLPEGQEVDVFGSWNPPKNPWAWINEYVDSHRNDPDYYIHHSTYLDDKRHYNSKQLLRKIQRYRDNDMDYYRWMYLGEEIGLGTNIFNMELFHKVSVVAADDEVMALAFSTDTGHMQSATALSAYGLTAKGNVYVLDTYYYSPAHQANKKPPSELVKDMHAFIIEVSAQYPNAVIVNKTIDSAEGAIRNQYSHDYHDNWHPVAKAKEADMIDVAQDLLAQGRVFVVETEGNAVFLDQAQKYQWDEKTIQSDNPKVIKENDHTCDEFKYFCLDNRRRLGLKR